MKRTFPSREKAVALLLVLGGLVLISVVVLAFLHSTATELKSSKTYADGGSVRQLSDTAVNLVIGQIRDATKTRDSSGKMLAWASQPGMIRTYDDSGHPAAYFKLYSSSTMTGTGAFNPAASTETVPASWNSDTGLYIDLNEPLAGRYPIVDPGAQGKVDGFSVDATAAAVAGKTNPLPMPAQWLYVLADGTIVAPAGSGSKAVVDGATPQNPIVSRIAFWTDDETAKININTASEGSFWDLPRVNSTEDVKLGLNQPTLNEFQRYPGHPATTSLSSALGWKLGTTGSNGIYDPAVLQSYYTIAPRVNDGGSKAGTVDSSVAAKITPDQDRLYASVDELEFRPDRTPLTSSTPALTADDIDKTRFFITARSRAPDVNLFNRPRVITWPISSQADASHQTIWDKAIAFCGTIGGQKFYFQRNNPDDPTSDLSLGNNRNLMAYLRTLTGAAIPGFGGNFLTKYGNDRDQILTEIFDYIRCTNLCDNNGNESGTFASFTSRKTNQGSGKGQVVPIFDATAAGGGARGFGRFPTLSEAAFVFIDNKDDYQPAAGSTAAVPATHVQMKAALLLELFDPSLGFPVKLGNYQIVVTGLNSMTWPDGSPMFQTSAPLVFKGKTPIDQTRNFGGNEGFRALLAKNTYNTFFSDTPSAAFPVGSTFNFPGGNITVEFQSASGVALQTITLYFPPQQIPVPLTVDSAGTPASQTNAGAGFQEFSVALNGRFSQVTAGATGAWVSQFDTVRSLSAQDGDYRLIAGRRTIAGTDNLFTPLTAADAPSIGPSAVSAEYMSSTVRLSHTLREAIGTPFNGAYRGWLVKNAPYWRASVPAYAGSSFAFLNPATDGNIVAPSGQTGKGLASQCGDQDLRYNGVAAGQHRSFVAGDVPGDWDNGFGDVQDGPYINKPDEGVAVSTPSSHGPYYYDESTSPTVDAAGTLFSPNRQIPSAVMFGSLSTGVKANLPWQTLLFRPDPSGKHPGAKGPMDHLLLDLFQMPIVEPYPISEPLSTAGRVNMNYQIVPFTYLTRNTGIRAVLKSERILAVDNNGSIPWNGKSTSAVDYKQNAKSGGAYLLSSVNWRKDIDLNETLKGFAQRFNSGDIFRSASEICTLPLVPVGASYAAVSDASTDFWYTNYPLTGDNSREKPYADIYPRLTTKSNTYAVHYRVQTLQKTKSRQTTAPTEFDPAAGDAVSGEYRGATVIERYVDPNDASLPDFSTASLGDASADLDSHYRFRTVSSKQFTP